MSRIDDLIAKYCSNGVEFNALGEVLKNLDSKRKPVTKKDRRKGKFPYYGANGIQDYVDDYIFDGTYLLIGEDGSVVNEDKTPVVNWASGKIWVNNHAHVLQSKSEDTLLRYVYFYLQTVDISRYVTGSAQPKLNQKNLNKIPLPVPPLEVQEEIVRILDAYTQLKTDLESELEAELEARRKQYEYYRDSLLSFENLNNRLGGGKLIPLGRIGKFTRGTGLQKKDFSDSGIGCIHYGQIYTRYGISTRETYSYVHPESFHKFRHAATGDILIATTSENDEDLGKAVAWMGQEEIAFSGDMCSYRHEINPKYVSYFMATESFSAQKRRFITGTKVRRITPDNIAKIEIPVPSLAEQERIVGILDKFDALVNDLTSGLPAEIAARRKQYEYYRDRLLTFTPAK